MAVHDWTRVEASTFHDFHMRWIVHLTESLNTGLLPPDYYAQSEQVPSVEQRRRTVAVRHTSSHSSISRVEIVSPGNKGSVSAVAEFVRKIHEAVQAQIHVVVVDLLPPGRHDRTGMYGALAALLGMEPYDVPADKPLTLVSCAASTETATYLDHFSVGDPLPDMPLFLTSDRYVNLPLGRTYDAAYRGTPGFWREVLEGRRPAP